MRVILCFIFFAIVFIGSAQPSTFQLWTETGAKFKLNKKLDFTGDWTNRIDEYGLNTSFPQASIRYKLNEWFKTSFDYRWILSKQENGYFNSGNRINLNVQGNYEVKRLTIGLRARYQYSFDRLIVANYDPEFDIAYRLKPSFSYDIDNSIITPNASAEYFYSPENAPLGNQFTRIRYQIGVDFETKLPLDLGITYLYDDKINLPNAIDRHVLNLSATYLVKNNKSTKKQKGRVINARDL
ncbi:MAG: DUF2490 domain-containing protein [Crocinitomicaceae bacterium]